MLILQQERATHLSVVVWLGASRSGIRPERGQPPSEEGGDWRGRWRRKGSGDRVLKHVTPSLEDLFLAISFSLSLSISFLKSEEDFSRGRIFNPKLLGLKLTGRQKKLGWKDGFAELRKEICYHRNKNEVRSFVLRISCTAFEGDFSAGVDDKNCWKQRSDMGKIGGKRRRETWDADVITKDHTSCGCHHATEHDIRCHLPFVLAWWWIAIVSQSDTHRHDLPSLPCLWGIQTGEDRRRRKNTADK